MSTGFAAVSAGHMAVGTSTTGALAAGTAAAVAALSYAGWILIAIGVVGLLGGVAYLVYRTVKGTYHKLISSTDAVLDLAIKQLLEWQCSTTKKDNSTEAVSKEDKLELLGKYENLTQS